MGYSDVSILVSRYIYAASLSSSPISLAKFCHARYTMVGIVPLLYLGYKVLKRSKFYKPEEVDLLKNLDEIEEYEANYQPQPAKCDSPLSLSCYGS